MVWFCVAGCRQGLTPEEEKFVKHCNEEYKLFTKHEDLLLYLHEIAKAANYEGFNGVSEYPHFKTYADKELKKFNYLIKQLNQLSERLDTVWHRGYINHDETTMKNLSVLNNDFFMVINDTNGTLATHLGEKHFQIKPPPVEYADSNNVAYSLYELYYSLLNVKRNIVWALEALQGFWQGEATCSHVHIRLLPDTNYNKLNKDTSMYHAYIDHHLSRRYYMIIDSVIDINHENIYDYQATRDWTKIPMGTIKIPLNENKINGIYGRYVITDRNGYPIAKSDSLFFRSYHHESYSSARQVLLGTDNEWLKKDLEELKKY